MSKKFDGSVSGAADQQQNRPLLSYGFNSHVAVGGGDSQNPDVALGIYDRDDSKCLGKLSKYRPDLWVGGICK